MKGPWYKNMTTEATDSANLSGQMLVAMPGMEDMRFARSLIFVCAHGADGAMGLVVNQPANDIALEDILSQLQLTGKNDAIRPRSGADDEAIDILRGGPVETRRGFVLHTSDFGVADSTLEISDQFSLSATIDVLRAVLSGQGPKRAILVFGHAGWSPGQLEQEIVANGWLHCPADEDLVFGPDFHTKYERALAKIGVDPATLSSFSGHA